MCLREMKFWQGDARAYPFDLGRTDRDVERERTRKMTPRARERNWSSGAGTISEALRAFSARAQMKRLLGILRVAIIRARGKLSPGLRPRNHYDGLVSMKIRCGRDGALRTKRDARARECVSACRMNMRY